MGIALAIITTWSLFLVLFLIGWARWGNRMERMDADMEAASLAPQRRIVSAGVRPYPE